MKLARRPSRRAFAFKAVGLPAASDRHAPRESRCGDSRTRRARLVSAPSHPARDSRAYPSAVLPRPPPWRPSGASEGWAASARAGVLLGARHAHLRAQRVFAWPRFQTCAPAVSQRSARQRPVMARHLIRYKLIPGRQIERHLAYVDQRGLPLLVLRRHRQVMSRAAIVRNRFGGMCGGERCQAPSPR